MDLFKGRQQQMLRTEANRRAMYDTSRPLECNTDGTQDVLIKGGEGSRGGKVIGHTRSGKPIYDVNPKHTNHVSGREGYHSDFEERHSSFTSEDHKDAADAHMKEFDRHGDEWQKHYDSVTADEWNNDKNEKGQKAVKGTREAAQEQNKHATLAKWHKEAAKQKEISKKD